MPTRKQRRRAQKERRHEYETVWVDAEGNELEEPPEDAPVKTREQSESGNAKAKSQPKSRQQSGRSVRVPPPPSWRRSIRRSVIWVVVLGVLMVWVQSRSKHPSYGTAIVIAAFYGLMFPFFTYYLDRWTYRRYQAKNPGGGPTKKR